MSALPNHIDRLCFNFVSSLATVSESEGAQCTLLKFRSFLKDCLHRAITDPTYAKDALERWHFGTGGVLVSQRKEAMAAIDFANEIRTQVLFIMDGFHHKPEERRLPDVLNPLLFTLEEAVLMKGLRLSKTKVREIIQKASDVKFNVDTKKHRMASANQDQFCVRCGETVLIFQRISVRSLPAFHRLVFAYQDPNGSHANALVADISTV